MRNAINRSKKSPGPKIREIPEEVSREFPSLRENLSGHQSHSSTPYEGYNTDLLKGLQLLQSIFQLK